MSRSFAMQKGSNHHGGSLSNILIQMISELR